MKSEKLRDYKNLIGCYVSPGAFSEEVCVSFPVYESDKKLSIESIVCHPDNVDWVRGVPSGEGFLRVDEIRCGGERSLVVINGKGYRVHMDSLIENF